MHSRHVPAFVRAHLGRLVLATILALGGTYVVAGGAAADRTPTGRASAPRPTRPAMRCRNGRVPVSRAPGRARTDRIFVRLCLPRDRAPRAVQVLVHGWSYDHTYWDLPDPRGGSARYSYVSSAIRAGYATLAYDRLGAGASSHPLSTAFTFDTGVWVAHQIVHALRAGRVAGPAGPVGFHRIVEVGHSFGSWYTWFEASRYHDVDAVILSSATHRLNVPATGIKAALDARPATLDQRFAGDDPGYLTTSPGRRYHAFYAPARVNPKVLAHDEATKQTGTAVELAAIPEILTTPLDIRAPVFIAIGSVDGLFCGSLATDCSSREAVLAPERGALGPHVPSVDGFLLPNGGHDLNPMPSATAWFNAAQRWASTKVPPE